MIKRSITVSVLVPTYCHALYIARAIESILQQEISFSIEVLLGDDNSDDATVEIASRACCEDSRVIIIKRKKNIGGSRNLYDLQKRAKGKYLAYLDGDDRWSDLKKLQKQIDFLEHNDSYIGCTHNCRIIDENDRERRVQSLSWIASAVDYTIHDFRGLYLPGQLSTLVHRNIFLDAGDQYRIPMTLHHLIADRSLFLLLASKGPIYRLPECMSDYRKPEVGGMNATTTVYRDNPNWICEDYQYTKELETYAEKILHIDGGFLEHKKDLFVSAIWAAVRRPGKEQFNIAWQILMESGRWACLSSFPLRAVKKLCNKIKQDG